MILVNAITKDGRVIPCGTASDMEDARNMVKFANKTYKLGDVVDFEFIKNPDDEDMSRINNLVNNFVEGEKNSEKERTCEEIIELYKNGEITGKEARNRIEVLYEGQEEVGERAIERLYHCNRHEDEGLCYDDNYDDEIDNTSIYDMVEEVEDENLRNRLYDKLDRIL